MSEQELQRRRKGVEVVNDFIKERRGEVEKILALFFGELFPQSLDEK